MEKDSASISLPQAILGGAIILAVAVAGSYAWQRHYVEANMPALVKKAIDDLTPRPENMAPITKDDHLLGSADAPVKLVVYTDLECPYCKIFHQSISELKADYVKDGKIAVVYRNFPLDALHQKSRAEAEASECAAKLGGNDKYWAFVDKVFEATPSNDRLDPALLPQFAAQIGLDQAAFASCQKDKAIAQKVADSVKSGEKAGAQGTPYPLIVMNGEVKGALRGALPATELRRMVDELTKKN